MRFKSCCDHLLRYISALSLIMAALGTAVGQTVTVQQPGNVLPDGSAFLMVEGENAYELNDGDPADQEGFAWVIVDKDDPLLSIDPLGDGFDILPTDTDASGGAAIMTELSGSGTARWQVQFEHPGTYYLYMSWSAYNRDNNPDYLNEDSFYLPPDFDLNSRSDWLGFEGTDLLEIRRKATATVMDTSMGMSRCTRMSSTKATSRNTARLKNNSLTVSLVGSGSPRRRTWTKSIKRLVPTDKRSSTKCPRRKSAPCWILRSRRVNRTP